jgi:hypothetical protein
MGRLSYSVGIDKCSNKDVFKFESIHMSTYRIYNPAGKLLFVNSTK